MNARPDHHPYGGLRGRTSARWRAAGVVTAAAALSLAARAVPAAAAADYTVTATIGVGAYPTAVAVDAAAGTVYMTNFDDSTASVIDEATSTVTATVPLTVASFPDAVAVDPGTDTAYVANSREPGVNDGTVSVITAVKVRTALTASITSARTGP
jgi:YVTN family beta-propeller protein